MAAMCFSRGGRGCVGRAKTPGADVEGESRMRDQRRAEAGPDDFAAGPAARWRLSDAATPQEVPGWDRLAAGRSCYVAADWLRFVDTDGVARSRYLGLSV